MPRTIEYWNGESWKPVLFEEGKEFEWTFPPDWELSLSPHDLSLLTSLLNAASNDFWFPSETAGDAPRYGVIEEI